MTSNGLQKHINEETRDDISRLYDHAKVANEEMGAVKTKLEVLEERVKEIKSSLSSINARMWALLILLLSILLKLFLK